MKYKLIDYIVHNPEEVTTGTCEICMSTRTLEEQYFYIQDEYGKVHNIPGFSFSWGDLDQIYIDNIAHFSAWLQDVDIEPPYDQECGYDYSWFAYNVISQYDYDISPDGIKEKCIQDNVSIQNGVVTIVCNNETRKYINGEDLHSILPYATSDDSIIFSKDTRFITPDEWEVENIPLFSRGKTITTIVNKCSLDAISFYDDGAVYLDFSGYDDDGVFSGYKTIPIGKSPCSVKISFSHDSIFPDISIIEET